MFVNSPFERQRFANFLQSNSSEDAAPLAFERPAEKKCAERWLLVRAIIADQLDIGAPLRLLPGVMAHYLARSFPVDDHRRAARIKLLIFHDGSDLDIHREARHAQSPAARITRSRVRARPVGKRFEQKIFARKMRPVAVSVNERAA